MASGYRPRIADAELRDCLAAAGAVVIEGPKACGKTRLAQQLAASTVLLDVDLGARQALAVDPALVLAGPRPRLLDEWQVAPVIWNQVRRAVDAVEAPGQFLLTGSAVPADDTERRRRCWRGNRPVAPIRGWWWRIWPSWCAAAAGRPSWSGPWRRPAAPPVTTWSRCARWTFNGWMAAAAIPSAWGPCCAPSAASHPSSAPCEIASLP
jgi:hypothetical protein